MEQAEAVVRLSCLPAFKDLIAKVQADEVSVLLNNPMGKEQRLPSARKLAIRDHVLCETHQVVFVHSRIGHLISQS